MLGVLRGELTGWRVAFASLSGVALVALITLPAVLPPLAGACALAAALTVRSVRTDGNVR